MNRGLAAVPYLCTVAPFIALAFAGAPRGHDLRFELIRVAAYAHAWQDGQFPPYWGGDLYGGWGSPIFLFYGQVYLAIASALSVLASSFALGSGLALACVTGFGAWAMQRAGSQLVSGDTAPLAGRVAAYVFLLNPYLLGDAVLRNANAEYTALCALPLAVCGVLRCADGHAAGPLSLAAGLALVFSAHLLSAGMTCALILVLVACLSAARTERRAFVVRVGAGFGLALSLSAFFWLPVLVYGRSIRTQDLIAGKFDYTKNFVSWRELLTSDTFHGAGPIPLIALGLAIALVVRKRASLSKRTLGLSIAFGAIAVATSALQTAWSAPVWKLLVAGQYMQFPWRLTGPLAFACAMLVALAVAHLTERATRPFRWGAEALVLGTCLIVASATVRQLQILDRASTARFEHQILTALATKPQSATVLHEYLPANARPELALVPAAERPALFNDRATHSRTLMDRPRQLVLSVTASREQAICLARWGFPFWRLAIDGEPASPIETKLGCLGVRVPAGTHRVEATLPVPWARRIGLALTLLGFVIAVAPAIQQLRFRSDKK